MSFDIGREIFHTDNYNMVVIEDDFDNAFSANFVLDN